MSQPVTIEILQEELSNTSRAIISHFNQSQGEQNIRLDAIDGTLQVVSEDVSKIKLAVLDLMVTDRHLHNLVKVLQKSGIAINDTEVFAQ